ncbi:glycosyltransferase family 39 protein [Spirulina subsalsa FACHB-351]|uniref:Glycosyltransferase family 39 protein n=1 Tax=Spirulina subsalsa FACHB-351 TaxID=234711 RepID=A0ABT3L0G9_9CYAN|nr:glycosyltransferase family 39 protein [Spirulina subsalsa]MCW6034981.1 glycosyltransferase family 39 protein [Spirulina subsalsa FACHB-351]
MLNLLPSNPSPEFNNKIKNYTNLFLNTLSIVILCSFCALIIQRTFSQVIIDHVEGQVASVSWAFIDQNYPLYHSFDNPERYTIVYGPLLYIITGIFLKLFSPNIWVLKLPTALALLFSLVCLFAVIQKIQNSKTALRMTAFISLIILCFGTVYGHLLFLIRSDALIFLFTCLGLWAVIQKNKVHALILLSLSFGISFNLKITAVLYFLPFYLLLFTQHGLTLTLVSGFAGIILGLMPFLHPQISWINYIKWLIVTTNHGFYFHLLLDNLKTTFYLFLPIILITVSLWMENKPQFHKVIKSLQFYFYVLLFSTAATIVIASKGGAGSHHLIPLIPGILYPFLLLFKIETPLDYHKLLSQNSVTLPNTRISRIISIIIALTLIVFTANHAGIKGVFVAQYYSTDVSEVINDLHWILSSYPNQTIGMGYAKHEQYALTHYRSLLVFAGNPLLIDGAALMDMQTDGIEIPQRTLEDLSSCRNQIWLIPKEGEQDGEPFAQLNYYLPNPPLFSEEFRQTFLENYEPRRQSQFFTLWFCKNNSE